MNLAFCAVIFCVILSTIFEHKLYYNGNTLSPARSFLQKDEFLFSVHKVSKVKTEEWIRTVTALIQNRNSQVTTLLRPFYYNVYI